MLKLDTGSIYYTHDGKYIQIVNVCKELLVLSVMNKSITVLELDTNQEFNISYCSLDTWGVKYLGNQLGVAQVLYGNNFKKR
jgi:hypothetical protein